MGKGTNNGTTCWPDHSWFQEIMRLATEPPRRLQPSEWFPWNATMREPIPKVMMDIKLIAWKLSSKSAPGMESQKKLKEILQTSELRVPERTTNKCLNSGVLSVIRKGYPHLKFV